MIYEGGSLACYPRTCFFCKRNVYKHIQALVHLKNKHMISKLPGLSPIQDGHFRGSSRMGGGEDKKVPPP